MNDLKDKQHIVIVDDFEVFEVGDLKKHIPDLLGERERFPNRLQFKGKSLDLSKSLYECNIKHGDQIYVIDPKA